MIIKTLDLFYPNVNIKDIKGYGSIFHGMTSDRPNEYYMFILDKTNNKIQIYITEEEYKKIELYLDKKREEYEKKNPPKLDLQTLIENILGWSKERELNVQDAKLQTLKLMEEVGELSASLLKDKKDELLDSLGDILVVLIILHQQLGFELEDSLNIAWNEIKDRNGKIIKGSFVKESDYK